MNALSEFEAPTQAALIRRLGISREAAELFCTSDVIDLHIESYSFYRSFGYHPHKRHTGGLHGALLCGQADLPRLIETGINGATWVITANPLRPVEDRAESFRRLIGELEALIESADGRAAVVTNAAEYRAAVAEGKHACFLGVQGANAFPPEADCLDAYASKLLRITLMHMSDSSWGKTSAPSPFFRDKGLGNTGREFVERMNALKIGVDLAHIHARGFWDVVEVHDQALPLLVTHTGVSGVHQHWRNLDDDQLKAIAQSGGTVGIMYHAMYLGDGLLSGKLSSVVRHIKHALGVIGPEHVSLGSDWDGLICTPRDMPTCSELPKLVDALLTSGVTPDVVVKILGSNFLRVIEQLKGELPAEAEAPLKGKMP